MCWWASRRRPFIFLTRRFNRLEPWPFWARATAAGVITAAVGLVAPEVLGIGYDTVDAALLGDVAWTTLLIILIGKMVASAACVGTGLPVGVITPTLVMGAVLGGSWARSATRWHRTRPPRQRST